MSSSDTVSINALSDTNIYIHKYVALVMYIVGNIGNLISALVFSRKSWKKNVCVFYFKVYILCTSVYINTTILGSVFISGYNIQVQNSSAFLCKTYFYVAFLFSSLSPSVLILASIDRLLISSQNVDTRLYSSKRLAYFSISVGTCMWIVFDLHILVKVHIQEFYPSVFLCYYDLSATYLNFVTYSVMLITVLFYVFVVVLSVIAFKNVRHIRTVPRSQRNQIRTMTKKDFQLLRCLFAHNIAFIIFSLWVNIYYVYSAVTKDQTQSPLQQAIVNFMDGFSSFLYNIPYCVSFFIFISISRAFRQELKRMVYKIFGKTPVIIREEQNRQENVEQNVAVVSTIEL